MLLVALLSLAVAAAAVVWAIRSARSASSSVDEAALAQRMAAEVRAQVGEAAVIGRGAKIGSHSRVGASAVVGDDTLVDHDSTIAAGEKIRRSGTSTEYMKAA